MIFIELYLTIAFISGFATGCWLIMDGDIMEIDNFWDWVIYNLLWIKQPLKSLWKQINKW